MFKMRDEKPATQQFSEEPHKEVLKKHGYKPIASSNPNDNAEYYQHKNLDTVQFHSGKYWRHWPHKGGAFKAVEGTGHHTLDQHLSKTHSSQHSEQPVSFVPTSFGILGPTVQFREEPEQFSEKHFSVVNMGGAGYAVKHKSGHYLSFFRNEGKHSWVSHEDNAAIHGSKSEAHEAGKRAIKEIGHPEDDQFREEEDQSEGVAESHGYKLTGKNTYTHKSGHQIHLDGRGGWKHSVITKTKTHISGSKTQDGKGADALHKHLSEFHNSQHH